MAKSFSDAMYARVGLHDAVEDSNLTERKENQKLLRPAENDSAPQHEVRDFISDMAEARQLAGLDHRPRGVTLANGGMKMGRKEKKEMLDEGYISTLKEMGVTPHLRRLFDDEPYKTLTEGKKTPKKEDDAGNAQADTPSFLKRYSPTATAARRKELEKDMPGEDEDDD